MSDRELQLIRNLANSYLTKQTNVGYVRQKCCHHQYFPNTVFHPFNNHALPQNNFCVRFAVNGLSKFTKGNSIPQMNRSIQAGRVKLLEI